MLGPLRILYKYCVSSIRYDIQSHIDCMRQLCDNFKFKFLQTFCTAGSMARKILKFKVERQKKKIRIRCAHENRRTVATLCPNAKKRYNSMNVFILFSVSSLARLPQTPSAIYFVSNHAMLQTTAKRNPLEKLQTSITLYTPSLYCWHNTAPGDAYRAMFRALFKFT